MSDTATNYNIDIKPMEGSQTENYASATGSQLENTASGTKDVKPMSESKNENTINESLVQTPMIGSKNEKISTERLELKSLTMSQTENTTVGGPDLKLIKGSQTKSTALIGINIEPMTASPTEEMVREGEEIKPMSELGNEKTDTENIDSETTGQSQNEDKGLACNFDCLGKAYTEFQRMPTSKRRLVLFCIAHAMSTVLVVIVLGSLVHQMRNKLDAGIHPIEIPPTNSHIPTSLVISGIVTTPSAKEKNQGGRNQADNQGSASSNRYATNSTISTSAPENLNTVSTMKNPDAGSATTETPPTNSQLSSTNLVTSSNDKKKGQGRRNLADNQDPASSKSSTTDSTISTSMSEYPSSASTSNEIVDPESTPKTEETNGSGSGEGDEEDAV